MGNQVIDAVFLYLFVFLNTSINFVAHSSTKTNFLDVVLLLLYTWLTSDLSALLFPVQKQVLNTDLVQFQVVGFLTLTAASLWCKILPLWWAVLTVWLVCQKQKCCGSRTRLFDICHASSLPCALFTFVNLQDPATPKACSHCGSHTSKTSGQLVQALFFSPWTLVIR